MAIELTASTPEVLSEIREALFVPSKNDLDKKDSLPAPAVFFADKKLIKCLSVDVGDITLLSAPALVVSDFTEKFLTNNNIFVEMVIFNKPRNGSKRHKFARVNFSVPYASELKPWGASFWNRSSSNSRFHQGEVTPDTIKPVRYNQLPVSILNERIDLSVCLNNHFSETEVAFINSSNVKEEISLITPGFRASSKISNSNPRFPYSRNYRPLYVAFRYINWLPNANDGRGQIVSGPLSKTVQVRNTKSPFNIDHFYSSIHGRPVCNLNPNFDKSKFICSFVS